MARDYLADGALKAHGKQSLSLNRELHWQHLENVLAEPRDDHVHRIPFFARAGTAFAEAMVNLLDD